MTTPDRGTTLRPASNALFTVDSEDRYLTPQESQLASSSPYNFVINGSRTLVPGFATRISCTELVFPFCVPNVIADRSDSIKVIVNVGGVNTEIECDLTQGFYTPADIALTIKNVVNADFPTFDFIYGQGVKTDGTFSAPAPVFSWNINLPNATVRFVNNNIVGNYKTLFDVMGFKSITGGSGTIPLAFGSSGFTFCQNIRYVDICSPQLTQNQGMPDSTTRTILRDAIVRLYIGDSTMNTVPCNDPQFCPPGCAPFVIYRSYPYPKQMRWNAEQNIGSYITFQVYDDYGNLLDTDFGASLGSGLSFDNLAGIDWNMSLLITEN